MPMGRGWLLSSVAAIALYGCFSARLDWSRVDQDSPPLAAPTETPTALAISPNRGGHGLTVTVTGTSFAENAEVSIGGVACTNLEVVNGTQLTCSVGMHTPATADLTIRNMQSESSTLGNAFTYANFLYLGHASLTGIEGFEVGENGALTLLSGGPFGIGSQFTELVLSANGKFLYAFDGGETTIHLFLIDNQTGSIVEDPEGVMEIDVHPRSIGSHPEGKYLYVGRGNTSQLAGFAIGPTGRLTELTTSPFAGTAPLAAITFSQDGRLLFAAEATGAELSLRSFLVDVDSGTLSAGEKELQTGGLAKKVCSHPSRNFIYEVGTESTASWSYDADGNITAIGSLVSTNSASHCAIDRQGKWVYVSRPFDDVISAFTVGSDGRLIPLEELGVGGHPGAMALHRSGEFLYAALTEDSGLSTLPVDPISGAISADAPITVTLELPRGLVLH